MRSDLRLLDGFQSESSSSLRVWTLHPCYASAPRLLLEPMTGSLDRLIPLASEGLGRLHLARVRA